MRSLEEVKEVISLLQRPERERLRIDRVMLDNMARPDALAEGEFTARMPLACRDVTWSLSL